MTHGPGTEASERDRLLVDEQAALRRVATLVAAGATSAELFAAVAEEVAQVLEVRSVMLIQFEADRTAAVLASLIESSFPVGSRWPLDGPSVSAAVLDTGRTGRIDDYSHLPGTLASIVRDSEIGASVGVPITVDGEVWGAMTVGAPRADLLPADIDDRLRDFTELVAIAISNAASRDRIRRLADEQAALRRVATLVAEGSTPNVLLSVVAEEVARIFDVSSTTVVQFEPPGSSVVVASFNDPTFPVGSRWSLAEPSINATVFATGRAARIDHEGLPGAAAAAARAAGMQSGVGAPIIVDGSVWGMVAVGKRHQREALPPDTETRLAAFTDLVSTAISKSLAHDDLRRLAAEQAALRRVATLVAGAAPPDEVFAAVAGEVAGLFGLPRIEMVRYGPGEVGTVIGASGDHPFPVGSRWTFEGPSTMAKVYVTGRPARIDDFAQLQGTIADVARAAGFVSAIGAPIVVDGAIWGAIIAISTLPEPIPEGAEFRLGHFTELVASAVSNLQARDEARGLAHEQAALRRVATLVAEGATAEALFSGVADEVAEVLGVSAVLLDRYDADGWSVTLATSYDPDWAAIQPIFHTGRRWAPDPGTLVAMVHDTGRAARVDDYRTLAGLTGDLTRAADIGSGCAAPITVDGKLWGRIGVYSRVGAPLLPADTESRLGEFTELVATAVSNVQARDGVRELAREQAALRRVATLVAEGATAEELFSGVATEVAQLLGVSGAVLDRYEPDGTIVTLAASHDIDWSAAARVAYPGMEWPLDPGSLASIVSEPQATARVDDYSNLEGMVGDTARELEVANGAAAQIVVDGKLWGLIRVFSREGSLLPADTEVRLRGFTELVATAVSNAAGRAELLASRARLVAAGDEARRRIERNLHDGTQQRLIALGLDLQRVRGMLPESRPDVLEGLDRMSDDLESVLEDVRELSRGLHPPLLSRGGLRPSLSALARRSPIPVDIDIELHERPPAAIETALYYVVSEALTNAIKHSHASAISVTVETDHAGVPFAIGLDGRRGIVTLQATIADDGVGGAEATVGSGLAGLVDRIDALGGRLELDSPPGRGTRISVVLPLGRPATS